LLMPLAITPSSVGLNQTVINEARIIGGFRELSGVAA
jgi:hypothetical protein